MSSLFTLISCMEDSQLSNTDDVTIQSGSIDKSFVDLIIGGEVQGSSFRIISLKFENNQLILKVQYSGGCKDHEFSLVWNGECDSFDSSKSTKFAIVHKANGDFCEALITKEITFDYNAIMKGMTAIEGCGPLTFINASNELTYHVQDKAMSITQGTECVYNVTLEEAICAIGFLDNLWFKNTEISITDDYDYFYFQPINIKVDENLEKGKYKIGVRLVEKHQTVAEFCLAYPGPSLPAEILCIEKVD